MKGIRQAGGSLTHAGTGLRADGTTFPREASIALFEFEGEELYCSIQRDISERKHLEQQLANLAEMIDEARTKFGKKK